jgi:hypothetical protein
MDGETDLEARIDRLSRLTSFLSAHPKIGRNVFPVAVVLSETGSQVMGIAISGITGVALLAIGSKFVMPIGVELASFVDLLGVASIMLSFGLADGE